MATTGSTDGQGDVPRTADKPPSYLISSVFVTILCCLPFGIVAIVYGLAVQTRWRAGDERGAMHASDMAEKWMYAGIGAAFLLAAAYGIWWFVSGRLDSSDALGIFF